MKVLRYYIRQIKRSPYIFAVVAIAVIAILVGAYIDLRGIASVPILEEATSTSTPSVLDLPITTAHYENEAYGYEFDYPLILERNEDNENALTEDIIEDSLFRASFPEKYIAGTNLMSAFIIAGVKNVNESVCLKSATATSTQGRIPPLVVTIGDTEFSVVSESDAGTGNLYTTTRYSTMHNDLCYTVAVAARSFNDIEGAGVKRYSQDKLDAVLDRLMQSFAFTN